METRNILQSFNITRSLKIKTVNRDYINEVNKSKYLGSWTESSEKHFSIQKALTWIPCHKGKRNWTSNMNINLKGRVFIAAVKPVLLLRVDA